MPDSSSGFKLDEKSANFDFLRQTTDVKKWINLVLSGSHPSSASTAITGSGEPGMSTPGSSSVSLRESEKRLSALVNAISLHSQEMSSTLETHISQCVARLPRMTLELNKMISDTVELQEHMKAIQTATSTISSKGAMVNCIQRLRELRTVDQKLRNCVYVMKRAREIESRIKRLEGLRSTSYPDSKLTSAQERSSNEQHALEDIPQLAGILFDVKSGLMELRKIESEFASQYNHLLEGCEQWIQGQLEERCLAALVSREVQQALPLFNILHRVGRSSEVLRRSHAQVSHIMVEECCGTSPMTVSLGLIPAPNFSERHKFSDRFITSFSEMIRKELVFWIQLSVAIEDGSRIPHFAKEVVGSHMFQTEEAITSTGHPCSREEATAFLRKGNEGMGELDPASLFLIHTMSDLLSAFRAEISPKLISAAEACRDASDMGYFLQCIKKMKGWGQPANEISEKDDVEMENEKGHGKLNDLDLHNPCYAKMVAEVNRMAKEILMTCLANKSVIDIFCQRLFSFVDGEVNGRLMPSQVGTVKISLDGSHRTGVGVGDDSEAANVAARFNLISHALSQACDIVLSFFPQKTMDKSITLWTASIKQFLKSLQVGNSVQQPRVLESLTFFVKLVRPSLLQCKTELSKHLTVSHSRQCSGMEEEMNMEEKRETNVAEIEIQTKKDEVEDEAAIRSSFQESLDALLWDPLEEIVIKYIKKSQTTVKGWILDPLLQKTADYHSCFVWDPSGENSSSVVGGGPIPFLSSNSTSASKPVRDLGEAIIEIPVSLDSIRALGVAAAPNKIWMEEVIEEVFETWLDEIVCMAIVDFVENKVLTLQLNLSSVAIPGLNSFSSASHHQSSSQYIMMVWERLRQDIKFLKNIVAAVRNDHQDGIEILEQVNDFLLRTAPPSSQIEGNCTVKEIFLLDTKKTEGKS